jgi:hypothetical protein
MPEPCEVLAFADVSALTWLLIHVHIRQLRLQRTHGPVLHQFVSQLSSCAKSGTKEVPSASHRPHRRGSGVCLCQVAVAERLPQPVPVPQWNRRSVLLSCFTSPERELLVRFTFLVASRQPLNDRTGSQTVCRVIAGGCCPAVQPFSTTSAPR